jgi:hypothetical protein
MLGMFCHFSRRESGMRRARNRSLGFHMAVCIVIAVAAVWIDSERIQPLLAPPDAPPPGLHLAWAGRPIRDYAESVDTYITTCQEPAYVRVALYPAVGRPWRPPATGLVPSQSQATRRSNCKSRGQPIQQVGQATQASAWTSRILCPAPQAKQFDYCFIYGVSRKVAQYRSFL